MADNETPDRSTPTTPQYTSGSLNTDLFGPHQSFYQSREQPLYHYRLQSTGERGKYKGELIIYDFRGGTGQTYGDFNRHFDRTQFDIFNKADTRFARHLLLNLKITEATTPDPSGTSVGICHERIFGRLMIGTGAGNGASLFRETSATNPVIEATAYNAGSAITAMDGIVAGGATATRKLLISRAGAAPQLISDVDGTVDSTGHSDLNPCWGACQTFLNDDTILFYADNGIYALPKTSAISAAPTLTQGNIADGGFWLDNKPFKVGSGPHRCYLAVPKQDTSGGMVPFGTTGDFEIISVNQEGFDPVPTLFPMLPKITWAGHFRQGIIATDNYKVVYYDGQQYFITSPFAQRVQNTAVSYVVAGAWIIEDDFYIIVREVESGTESYVLMFWDADTLAWHFTSDDTAAATVPEACRGRGLPWSFNSTFYKFLHWYMDGFWARQSWVSSDENPFYMQMDATSGDALEFATTGDALSTIWDLPGLEGKPKSITAITYMGNLSRGNASGNTTPAQITVNVGERSAVFKAPADTTWQDTAQRITFNTVEVFDKLEVTVAITQGTGGTDPTFYTPNALPIKIEFIAWEYPTPGFPVQTPSLPLTA